MTAEAIDQEMLGPMPVKKGNRVTTVLLGEMASQLQTTPLR